MWWPSQPNMSQLVFLLKLTIAQVHFHLHAPQRSMRVCSRSRRASLCNAGEIFWNALQ